MCDDKKPIEYVPCDACGTLTDIDLLDAKDDGTGNYTILHCRSCYGPGWAPAVASKAPDWIDPDVAAMQARQDQLARK